MRNESAILIREDQQELMEVFDEHNIALNLIHAAVQYPFRVRRDAKHLTAGARGPKSTVVTSCVRLVAKSRNFILANLLLSSRMYIPLSKTLHRPTLSRTRIGSPPPTGIFQRNRRHPSNKESCRLETLEQKVPSVLCNSALAHHRRRVLSRFATFRHGQTKSKPIRRSATTPEYCFPHFRC